MAADFLLLAAPETNIEENKNEHNVSAVSNNGYDGFEEVEVGKSGVELRYHTKEEYKTLSTPQRDELRTHREQYGSFHNNKNKKRGGGGGNNSSENKKKKPNGNEARIAALETTNKDLADQVKDLIATIASQVTLPPPPPTTQPTTTNNRTNNNLTRVPRPPTQNA